MACAEAIVIFTWAERNELGVSEVHEELRVETLCRSREERKEEHGSVRGGEEGLDGMMQSKALSVQLQREPWEEHEEEHEQSNRPMRSTRSGGWQASAVQLQREMRGVSEVHEERRVADSLWLTRGAQGGASQRRSMRSAKNVRGWKHATAEYHPGSGGASSLQYNHREDEGVCRVSRQGDYRRTAERPSVQTILCGSMNLTFASTS